MSSSRVWRPDCALVPSRIARRGGILLHGMLALLLLTSDLPRSVCLPALALLAMNAWRTWCRPFQAGHAGPRRLRQLPSGWRVTLEQDEQAYADLAGPVRDWGFLLCFCLRERAEEVETGCRPRVWRLALWQDQLPPDDWRRLRVSLVWRRHADPRQRVPRAAKPSGTSTLSQASGSRPG